MTLLRIKSEACFRVKPDCSFPALFFTPSVSVIKISFSAFRADAIFSATKSALILSVSPFSPLAIGAITGINSFWSKVSRMCGFTLVISPTSPRSIISGRSISGECFTLLYRFARIMSPSFPVMPTALPPRWLIRETISLFTFPPSTISTTSIVSLLVTRCPSINRD